MSRIEPIPPCRALVPSTRRPATWDASRSARFAPADSRRRRASDRARPPIVDAAAWAAFEVHRLTESGRRGLKADLAVRRQWASAYATASQARDSQLDPMEWARA
jgi:hypothetical protein